MIKSSLDLHRHLPAPELELGEKIVRKCTGTLDIGQKAFSTFRPCNIYLTDRRLLLAQVRKVIKDFRYSTIMDLAIIERKWLAGKRVPQLQITLKSGKVHFVVMNEPWMWLEEMAGLGGMKVHRNQGDSSPILLPEESPETGPSRRKHKKEKIKGRRKVRRCL